VKLGLAGDTMLGRGVAQALGSLPPSALFAPEVVEAAHEADLFLLNLECCISARGTPWPDPDKPFFFRAPPRAVEVLALLGVDCVTLANNHALDFGREALLDTLGYLHDAGIACVGAGRDLAQARAPAVLERNGFHLGVIGLTDHPEQYAATVDRPGVAYADLSRELPSWLREALQTVEADAVLVSTHCGPIRVAFSLIASGNHFLLDIAAGAVLAAVSAWVVRRLERRCPALLQLLSPVPVCVHLPRPRRARRRVLIEATRLQPRRASGPSPMACT
jgi:hypothetical protein